MINDPIGDTIIRLKNLQNAKKGKTIIPFSRFRFAFCQLLSRHDFLNKVEKKDNQLVVELGKKTLSFRRFSRLSQKIYVSAKKIPRLSPNRILIISTPKGLMSGLEAKQKNLGGELIGEVSS